VATEELFVWPEFSFRDPSASDCRGTGIDRGKTYA